MHHSCARQVFKGIARLTQHMRFALRFTRQRLTVSALRLRFLSLLETYALRPAGNNARFLHKMIYWQQRLLAATATPRYTPSQSTHGTIKVAFAR